MSLTREDISGGLLGELTGFEDLVRSLADGDLAKPSRCEGWSVRDVASHVIGTLADVVGGRLEGLGTPEVTAREVEERRGRSSAELADELAGARKAGADILALFDDNAWNGPSPGGYDGPLGRGVEALWYDAYLHADDIRDALGQAPVRTDGLRASLSHVAFELTKRGWGPATLAFEGYPTFDIGEGGVTIGGDAHEFVLAATGRRDPEPLGLDASVNIYG